MPMPETSPHIYLRPLEPEDLTLLYTIENDMEIWDASNTDGPYSRYALKQYIASARSVRESGELRMVIDLTPPASQKANYHPIGLIDLTNYVALDARAEVSIALLKEYRNKGFGLQALQKIEEYATRWLRIHLLYAHIAEANTYSLRMFEKAAYERVATLPQWHYANGQYESICVVSKTFSA